MEGLFVRANEYQALVETAASLGWEYVYFEGCSGGLEPCPMGEGDANFRFVTMINPACGGAFQAKWIYGAPAGEGENCEAPNYYHTSDGTFMEYHGTDTDSDGVLDYWDNCDNDVNPWQSDFNRDGEGDVCDDEKPDIRDAEFGDRVCMGSPDYRPHHPHIDNQQFQGNPINIYNGNKVETKTDISFQSAFEGGFVFKRSYNSQKRWALAIGHGWRHNFHFSLYRGCKPKT